MRVVDLVVGFAAFLQCIVATPIGDTWKEPAGTPAPKKLSTSSTTGPVKTPKTILVGEADTPRPFQGDMMLTDEQELQILEAIADEETGRKKRKATPYENHRWTARTGERIHKIVPYVIASSLSGQSTLIRRAMTHWEQNTCLRFEPLTPSHPQQLGHNSYISFFRGSGCWSHVGRAYDGEQQVSIGTGCASFGKIIHEIGHAIGFHHEQSRPDRDAYINVNYANIQPGHEHEFARYTWGRVISEEVAYDVGSIMHYGAYYFSSNGRRTITTRDPSLQYLLGQRTSLSPADIELANRIYDCNDIDDCSTADECLNGGYHDTDCVCVCPEDYSGDLCQDSGPTSQPECVARFTDSSGAITSPNYPSNYDDNENCVYRIEGPPGSTIQLTFRDMNIENEALCRYDSVEVRKDGANMAGEKFCGNALPTVQVSSGNEMVVVFTSDPSITRRGFLAVYVIEIESVPTTDDAQSTITLTTTPITTSDSPTTEAMPTATDSPMIMTTPITATTDSSTTTAITTTTDSPTTTSMSTTEMTTEVTVDFAPMTSQITSNDPVVGNCGGISCTITGAWHHRTILTITLTTFIVFT